MILVDFHFFSSRFEFFLKLVHFCSLSPPPARLENTMNIFHEHFRAFYEEIEKVQIWATNEVSQKFSLQMEGFNKRLAYYSSELVKMHDMLMATPFYHQMAFGEIYKNEVWGKGQEASGVKF